MNPETLRAVVDCLIPADDFPGAYDAGVCDYIDRLLQTDLADHVEFFRAGLEATDAEAPDQQIATLAGIESGVVKTSWPIAPSCFFEMLVNITAEGYYSDPQQGGNRGCVSWVMTGFEVDS